MKVIVIGGGGAGMTAASRVRKLKPEWDVKVFEETSFASHAPCGIPYVVEGLIENSGNLMYYKPDFFKEKRGIDLHMNASVMDADGNVIEVEEEGKETYYEWDKLLIATGASPRVPPIDGVDLNNVFTVHLPPDSDSINKASKKADNVIILGAGYIGLEIAEAFASRGKSVTILEEGERPLSRLDEDISDIVRKKLDEKIDLRTGEHVISLEGGGTVERVITENREYKADLVILATGVKPNTEIAKRVGCRLGRTGAILADGRMRTTVENVFAAGDCAETLNLVTGERVWVPLAPTANKMGYVAGTNICEQNLVFPGILGTQVTKFFDLEIGSTGLNKKEAEERYEIKTCLIKAGTRAHYYPGGGDIWLKLIAEKESNRLLGAQLVGTGILPRLNTLATMITAEFTTKECFFTDLAYAPPFAPVWDPIIVGSRVLKF